MRLPTRITLADRARWLAELAVAIEEAQLLVWRIGVLEGGNAGANELYGRLEQARSEIESLRGVRELARDGFDPEWMKLSPWGSLETLG